MGFLPPFSVKNIPKNIKKNADATEKGTFFPTIRLVSPREDACVSFRFTPSREGCARSTTRPLDETARYFHAKDPRGSMETRRARFRTKFVPRNVFVTLFFFGSKSAIRVNTHTKKRSITISLPNGFFPVKRVQQQQQKKTRGETEFFFSNPRSNPRVVRPSRVRARAVFLGVDLPCQR